MLNEKNKATRIMKEIMNYFLDNDLNNFDLSFHIDSAIFTLSISAPTQEKPASFDRVLSELKTDRQIEVDEYFNALLGSHCHDNDYSFLGKSIDYAQGGFENGKLWLEIKRYNMND